MRKKRVSKKKTATMIKTNKAKNKTKQKRNERIEDALTQRMHLKDQ